MLRTVGCYHMQSSVLLRVRIPCSFLTNPSTATMPTGISMETEDQINHQTSIKVDQSGAENFGWENKYSDTIAVPLAPQRSERVRRAQKF